MRAERGRGTFVNAPAPRLSYAVGPRTRFSENVLAQSRRPGGRLIRAARVRGDTELAAMLGCPAGAPLHRLESLHVADGVPLSVSTSWLSAERFPDIVQHYAESGSITEALRSAGLDDYRRRETRLTAERVAPDDADALAASPDALVLVARAIDEDLAGTPIQVSADALPRRTHGAGVPALRAAAVPSSEARQKEGYRFQRRRQEGKRIARPPCGRKRADHAAERVEPRPNRASLEAAQVRLESS